jgi:tRNA (mo5U34)-methyltransferase
MDRAASPNSQARAPRPSRAYLPDQDRQALITRAMSMEWFHSIDLGGGVKTPGPPHAQTKHIQNGFDVVDFTDKLVLDVGAWDGLWTYEAERRGARQVVSIDLISERDRPEFTTFEIAGKILGSNAEYHPHTSVYDVANLGRDDFDVVLFNGVIYHLKDPLLALARLRSVMKTHGIILVESEVVHSKRSYSEFYYHHDYAKSPSNWFIPSTQCMREWVECSFFRVEHEFYDPAPGKDGTYGRHLIVARAVPIRKPDRRRDAKNYFSRYDFLDAKAED